VYSIAIGITSEPPMSKYSRRLNAVMKEVQREVADYWADRMLPGHFEHGAAEKYGYAPRTTAHERRKRQKPPLVFSGFGREQILRPPYIQASPTRMLMELAAPSYFWASPPSNHPDKADEVSRMTFQEQQQIMMRMGKNASRMIQEMGGKETVILTGG
jgi:hypothetical protein